MVVWEAAARLQGNAIVGRILSSGGRAGDTAPFSLTLARGHYSAPQMELCSIRPLKRGGQMGFWQKRGG